MITQIIYTMVLTIGLLNSSFSQQPVLTTHSEGNEAPGHQKVVIVTGARFSYPLVQRWIDEFNKTYPDVQIIIESRGSTDPLKFDVLAEVYEQDAETKKHREYLFAGRYAILPVATANSEFSRIYSEKGLDDKLLKQIFFYDVFAEKDNELKVKTPFTVYTRLQKAGAPKVFADFYGFDQKNINGKAIAGSDEHLLKALLRDSTGITYLPLPLIYDIQSGKPISGLKVIPVDVDGNGKVKEEEKSLFRDLTVLVTALGETGKPKRNIPIEYLHLSVDRRTASPEAVAFLKWVAVHGDEYLAQYGFFKAEEKKAELEQFNNFVAKTQAN